MARRNHIYYHWQWYFAKCRSTIKHLPTIQLIRMTMDDTSLFIARPLPRLSSTNTYVKNSRSLQLNLLCSRIAPRSHCEVSACHLCPRSFSHRKGGSSSSWPRRARFGPHADSQRPLTILSCGEEYLPASHPTLCPASASLHGFVVLPIGFSRNCSRL